MNIRSTRFTIRLNIDPITVQSHYGYGARYFQVTTIDLQLDEGPGNEDPLFSFFGYKAKVDDTHQAYGTWGPVFGIAIHDREAMEREALRMVRAHPLSHLLMVGR